MALYYPECQTTEPAYTCSPCPTGEFARVRSVAFQKTSYSFYNYESPSEWSTAITNEDVIVIWQTQGSYNGGTTTELPGFGDTPFYNGNTLHTLVYKDPNFIDNCDFYNAKKFTANYTVIFRTSSRIWVAGSTVVITPKNAVADDINQNILWEVTVKWTNQNQPCTYATPAGIFDTCFVI